MRLYLCRRDSPNPGQLENYHVTTKNRIVKLTAVSAADFGRNFAAASGRLSELVLQGKASFPHFPDSKKMAEKTVDGINAGFRLHYAETAKSNGGNAWVKTDKGFTRLAAYLRKAKLTALPSGVASVDIPVDKALSFSKLQLETLKKSDAALQAAYVEIRSDVSTYVTGQWRRLKAQFAAAMSETGSKRRGARGATKLFRDACYAWADGLVKKAKLAAERGDGTAPDPVKLAALVASFKAGLVDACK
jgi:hypothetical protein